LIHAAATLTGRTLHADVCIIGSGAGGAMAAMVAAEAGLRVVVLEAGGYFAPEDMTQREEQMLPQLYWDAAGRTTHDRKIRIHQGKGVGGSTLHNLNLCKRIARPVLEQWQRDHGMRHLPLETWDKLYAEVEALLEVSAVPRERWNRHNQLLEQGCHALGWQGGGLQHNRTGCLGSGFCEVGCAYDAKNNAAKVLMPRAIHAGAEVLIHAQATKILHENGRATGVQVRAVAPQDGAGLGELTVLARRVVVAASATGTAALLLRSKVPDASGLTGKTLRIHPAVVVAGDFTEPVNAWQGIPQTYECTEFLDFAAQGPAEAGKSHRLWIVPAFGHPLGTATMMPAWGETHRALMSRYAHLGVLTAMLHETTAGTVTPDGELGVRIDYAPNAADRRELLIGLQVCARLLLAAGARRVWIPSDPPRILHTAQEVEGLASLEIETVPLTAVHPMGSVPMGDAAERAVVDSQGRHHGLGGLWVADGSLFPTSIGVPPQLSVYAMGLHVGRAVVGAG
jgi:choline dehydrogenase-like flavoprotein